MRIVAAIALLGFAIGWFSSTGTQINALNPVLDVSWPNCGVAAPVGVYDGVVGITGGLAFRPNPCAAQETGWFKHLSAYVNTGYPGIDYGLKFQDYPKRCRADDNACLAYNYGYNSGLYDIKYALTHGVVADRWWLDVETENSWTTNTSVNRAALQGNFDALARLVGPSHLGYYSYPGQWNLLTGNWRNGADAWIATGSTRLNDAVTTCRTPAFTGGPAIMTQYIGAVDQSYVCKTP